MKIIQRYCTYDNGDWLIFRTNGLDEACDVLNWLRDNIGSDSCWFFSCQWLEEYGGEEGEDDFWQVCFHRPADETMFLLNYLQGEPVPDVIEEIETEDEADGEVAA